MKKEKQRKGKITIFIISLLLCAITIYNLYVMYKNIEITNSYEAQKTILSTKTEQKVENTKENAVDIIEETTKSVVGISKLTNTGGSILNNISSEELGLGTGIIVSENGYILSNSHVTGEKYSTCYITIEENTYKGTVVWNNDDIDLSIVKIQASNLPYIKIGDSSNIKIGQTVYAIGNPIGYEFRKTVTSGIISAINRTIKIGENESTSYMSDLIQTDATINPGNSGGPLINTNGEVIGINTVKITSAEGIGFAMPINVVKPVIEAFDKTGKFEEPSLGIQGYDGDVAGYLNLKTKWSNGVYVSKIINNGPASFSELKEGDLITKVDEKNLYTINDLREYVYRKSPGDTLELKILKNGIEKIVNVNLGKK